MMIEPTPKNVEWLIERLYFTRRELQAYNVASPSFVLLTKNIKERHEIEKLFLHYFYKKYGDMGLQHMMPEVTSPTMTSFCFPEIQTRVCLMDLDGHEPEA